MDIFNQRISLNEAATIVQNALRQQHLGRASSAIFHHLGMMRARLEGLQAAFPKSTLHAVAIKANPVVEILREVVHTGCGLEAASIEEVELARAAGCPAQRIVFDSPAKTRSEIRQALAWGVYLNADNFDELDRIAAARAEVETNSVVGLRVNAMVGGGSIAHTSVSQSTSKFGIPLRNNQQKIIEAYANHKWLDGLHVHVGSQGCQISLLAEAAKLIAGLRSTILAGTGRNVANVDIGGGLPTVYSTGDEAPTLAEYRTRLEEAAPDLFPSPSPSWGGVRGGANFRLITEFGRAIHANCGLAVSRVEYVKPAQRLAVIHLGADFLLRPVYRAQDWMHEFYVLNGQGLPKQGPTAPVSIAGPLCFAGDIIAREVSLPRIEEGDWIVIRDVGAYTLSMWSRHCSRAIPAVLGYDSQAAASLRILRTAETPADLVRFWSAE